MIYVKQDHKYKLNQQPAGVLPIIIQIQGPNISVRIAEGQVMPSHKRFSIMRNWASKISRSAPVFSDGLCIIYKESDNIKHPAEPGNDKNNVKGLYI